MLLSVSIQHDQFPSATIGFIHDADISVAAFLYLLWKGKQPGGAVLPELVRVEDLPGQRHSLYQTATGRLGFVVILTIP